MRELVHHTGGECPELPAQSSMPEPALGNMVKERVTRHRHAGDGRKSARTPPLN